jgi:hypothetical protein
MTIQCSKCNCIITEEDDCPLENNVCCDCKYGHKDCKTCSLVD